MTKKLVIVESPAKAKTIGKFLGKNYQVEASMGHVRDLPEKKADLTPTQKKLSYAGLGVNIEKNFDPLYVVPPDKKKIIKKLKDAFKESDELLIATDEDREGEAIGWHLVQLLCPKGKKEVKRIVFHEITQNAITNALNNPRPISQNLVNAQQARRVLDRLVGYELSPLLWKKVQRGLSAGRVQSVAVRMIVEREREINSFNSKSSYKIKAIFDLEKGKKLLAEHPKKFPSEKEAKDFLEKCKKAQFEITDLQKKQGKKKPAAPFTTSTLQQEASRKLSFSVLQTMRVAQKLYEAGYITYMRTDSVNLAKEAVSSAAQEIESLYGKEYVQTRSYKTKSKSAQEAHEAIRPTNFSQNQVPGEASEQRLYELIWKRAIASQMADVKLEKTTAQIGISNIPGEKLVASGEVVKFEGFLKVYIESTDEEGGDSEEAKMLPPLKVQQILDLNHMKATERFSRPSARFTEASLVKHLEEMGIGRPSTYAPTITTIQKRNYVLKESREGKERKYKELTLAKNKIQSQELTEITGTENHKLFPTNTGMIVNDFLVSNFPNIIDYSFTVNIEEQFDSVANGKKEWNEMLGDFYGNFHENIEQVDTKVDRSSTGAVRTIGVDPKSGLEIIARLGRYGPFVQIGEQEGAKCASLRKGDLIETITLEDALELFKLPRDVGEFEGKKIVANVGRFGPYVRHDNKFVSLGKEIDPLEVDEETAIKLILEKREKDSKKTIKIFDDEPELKVLNGRWGPYISYKKKNFKIAKDIDASKLTLEKCHEIIKDAAKKTTVRKKKKG